MKLAPRRSLLACLLVGLAIPAQAGDVDGGSVPEATPRWSARRFAISDLDGIVHPVGITSAALGRRPTQGRKEARDDLVIETRCGKNWCVDGLAVEGRTLIPALPRPDEAKLLREEGAWLERVLRVVWQDGTHLSLYVAQSEFSGGAHANNILRCRTYAKKQGRPLGLGQFLDKRRAGRVLGKTRRWLGGERDGMDIETAGFTPDAHGFRLETGAGGRPAVVLCAEGSYPSESDAVIELRLQAIPALE
jgi:hypothetical protein